MAELIVFLRSREISRVPVMLSEITIGRDEACDVHIDNPGVSRRHAVLTYGDGTFRIRDDRSENGITVNGRAVDEAELRDGDIVGINKFKVRFSEAGGVPPEMLEAPTRAAPGTGGNVVATMTVNADAAKAMQQRFIAQRKTQAEAAEAPAAASWPWFLAALVLVGVASYFAVKLLTS